MCRTEKQFIALILLLMSMQVMAEQVSYKATSSEKMTQARLGRPSTLPETTDAPAVVLLHHGGGCDKTQTKQYADALNKVGFFTLEPCLFNNSNGQVQSTVVFLPQVFGALKYLASVQGVDRNRISIMGGSYGAALAFISATSWAYTTHADKNYPPFASHAVFYPSCFIYERFLKNRIGRSDLPGDAYDQLNGAPIRIYSGGKDDYDSKDPNVCQSMIRLFSPSNQQLLSLKFFPNATHGWDHETVETFFDPRACKGRGCLNTNIPDKDVTQVGLVDYINFLEKINPIRK
jgi:uncharacterized protein